MLNGSVKTAPNIVTDAHLVVLQLFSSLLHLLQSVQEVDPPVLTREMTVQATDNQFVPTPSTHSGSLKTVKNSVDYVVDHQVVLCQ
jgi:hypothetical protein